MDSLLPILAAMPVTLTIVITAFVLGAVLALPLLAGLRSRIGVVRALVHLIVDIFRGIPPIVWLFILYFGVGRQFFNLDGFGIAIVGLSVIAAAYLAEMYRGGLSAVPVGQWEAARALGLPWLTMIVRVIGPQAFRSSAPAITSYAINMLKDSAIISTIGVVDIVFAATTQSYATGDGFVPFLIAGAVYIVIGLPLVFAARTLDARLTKRVTR